MVNEWVAPLSDTTAINMQTFAYDGRGGLSSSYNYSAVTLRGGATVADGLTINHFIYDQAGQLKSRWQPGVSAETYLYDGLGRMISSANPASGTVSIAFTDGGEGGSSTQTIVVTTAGNYVTTASYNKAGELTASTDSGSWRASAQANNTPVTTDASYQYDNMGRLRVFTDARDDKTYYIYDAVGRKVGEVREDGTEGGPNTGSLVEYRYDLANRLVATYRYSVSVTADHVTQLANPGNTLTIGTIRPAAHPSHDIRQWTIYDAAGRVWQTISGTGAVTSFAYDGAGNLISTRAHVQSVPVAGYFDNPPTNPLNLPNNANDVVSRSFYDRSGRYIGALDGEGYLTEVVYNAAGQKVEEVAYANKITPETSWASGTFTNLRLSANAANAANRRTYFAYDGQGLLRYQVNDLGQVASFAYDGAGRVTLSTQHAAPVSTSNVSYENLRSVVVANASNDRSVSTTYDLAGRVSTTTGPLDLVTTYSYDVNGNVIRVQQGSGADARITRSYYGAGGQLRFTVDAEGYVTRHDYDPEGHKILERRFDSKIAVSDSTTISQVHAQATGTFAETLTEYDNQDRLTSTTNGEGDKAYHQFWANGFYVSTRYAWTTSSTADDSWTTRTNDASGRVLVETSATGGDGRAAQRG